MQQFSLPSGSVPQQNVRAPQGTTDRDEADLAAKRRVL